MEQKGFAKRHRVKNNETWFPCIYEVKYSKEINHMSCATEIATSFPGPLVFPSPGARGEGKTRGPGNEVAEIGEL